MSRIYHIFRVYDYKGGELSADANLSEDIMLSNVLYLINADDDDDDDDDDEIPKTFETDEEILMYLKKCFKENTSIYAGSGKSCFEIYYSENNKLYSQIYDDAFYNKLVEAHKKV